ncbi:hypothetical protein AQ765_24075 [Burkholderia pseudomallei]|nr:hypothetical protein T210_0100895 [Burkholderia pseudomallei MSHR6137]KGS31660.1 hypothetical protein X989_1602 [Burkholderia pseudomallei MSHR4378]KGU69530.1 hypothetical protein Y035_4341 [Burkholderia pseudomallei MSHR465J]KYZ79684.1 hypothetical protein PTBPS01_31735 [Burkholderia pseudomallei]OMT66456.1 hypothetical protein AQ762_30040 [Burkholderia pseudomallei]
MAAARIADRTIATGKQAATGKKKQDRQAERGEDRPEQARTHLAETDRAATGPTHTGSKAGWHEETGAEMGESR